MSGRTILMTQVVQATPAQIWACWTDPDLLPRWFGPKGHRCVTHEIDLRQGGHWLFDMIGPAGEVYPNLHRYDLYLPQTRLEYRLFDPRSDDLHAEAEVTLTPVAGGCRVTLEMTFPSRTIRDAAVNFGAVELGQTSLQKLATLAQAQA
ncbi:SRPBCC domain-containing protein [Pseudotabrizicola sp. L79]|uniref:SRPBCC domain-containing protein n=1 Tax=Pseudotabrizicola sp. L79 TaxID=3118402 RepID=UPI002F92A594